VEQREVIREQIVERIIEREPDPRPSAASRARDERPAPHASPPPVPSSNSEPSAPQSPPELMDRVMRWLARVPAEPREDTRVTGFTAGSVPLMAPPSVSDVTPPAALPPFGPSGTIAIDREPPRPPPSVPIVVSPREKAPAPGIEETIEIRIGSINVVVEGSPPARAESPRPPRRPAREPESPAPDSVRRYGLLPD
jgi:hypothetical protein